MFGFFKRTVDSIIADIQVRIEHLHLVAEAHQKAAELHSDEIAIRSKLVNEAKAEYARAKSIAGKFQELIS